MKLKNKKSLIFIVLVFVVFLVLGSFAFLLSTDTFENIFSAGIYKTVTREVFQSPTNWTPGDETPKTITTKNEGTIPVRVRVKLDESWTSRNGDSLSTDLNKCAEFHKYDDNYCVSYHRAAIINFSNKNDWLYKDGYYYYIKELAPGESTSTLLESVTFNPVVEADVSCTLVDGVNTCESTGNGYDGAVYRLNITTETVQANKYDKVWENVPIMYDYVGDNPCSFDGELIPGAEYVNGQYTYRYRQEIDAYSSPDFDWADIGDDGWGVKLTDSTSTNPVTTPLCSSINNKPIVSMSLMFFGSQADTLDLSSFDTSNVNNMGNMFFMSKASSLDLSSFNTSNVTDMNGMFASSAATTLDISSFDTGKVINMGGMFYSSNASSLDLSNFDTSSVISMHRMFENSKALSLDLSNFDTSNVISMTHMFFDSEATTINLSSFDTANVEDMSWMFKNTELESLDLSNFDTGKVTDMSDMFAGCKTETLDLSSFDTSNVIYMGSMFSNSEVETINLNSFDTSKVKNMSSMFAYSKTAILDLSSFDTSNVTNMYCMFLWSRATDINVSSFDTSNVTNMYGMFEETLVTSLDLSSFDMSKVTDTFNMFIRTKATVGYGRTQADCDKLNASGHKPSGLTFVVK